MKSYGNEGRYIALVVGRFGEFSKDFVKLRKWIVRRRTYAYNDHHGDVDVQAKYHSPLGADGGAWLGPAYP